MDKRVLIIEDEVSIAELEKDYLEINGFSVDMAHTGSKGLQMVQRSTYDLVVLDLMLPEINGFDICKQIREKQDIPIVMVSAKKEDIDKIRGLGLGADDYMTKPFSPNELVARVKAHIARYDRLVGKEKVQKEINIRNLTLQTDSRRVLINGEEVILTTKEYELLLFLASNPDKVFSKEVLLDRIWGIEHFGDAATVTVHIGKLRDKIDKQSDSQHTFIETVWGAGYRFMI